MFLSLLFMATIFHFQFQMCHANCRFSINKTSLWAQCQCEEGGVANGGEGIRLNCWKMDWEKLPELRGIWEAGNKEENGENGNDKIEQTNSRNSIGALSIKFTRIGQLGQDAFRTEPNIQLLELCQNAIQTINANAFRGLEAQLIQLHLSGNRLEQIPSWALTYLRQLQNLKLEGNQIEQIGADTFAETHLPNLRYFHLDGNRISTIQNGSLSRLPVLQVLTLAANRIEQIEPNSLPNSLWFLDLKDNRLPNIPFSALDSLSALKMLDLERNNITELRGAPKFAVDTDLDLKLAHNRIRLLGEGAFDGFRRFGQLDLSHNQIGSISEKAFRSIHSIQSLDLSSNSLLQIPQNAFLRFAHSLRRLRLDQNQLAQLPAAIAPLMGLRQLSLDGNQLGGLATDEFVWKGLKANLSELSLARNGIERIPSEAIHGMASLRSLDLSRNSITKIGKMAFGSPEGLAANGGISPLQRLNLAGNRIRELADPGAFLYLGQLAHLDCSHNRINRLTKATLERLESLETLSLDHNEMLEFPRNALSSLTRLRQLTMEANRLVMLPNYAFQWLVHLQRLNLARNRLHTLNAKNFHSTSAIQIKWLSLAHNRISRMETAAFLNLPNLEQLFLHHNRLTVLQTQIISSLKNLRQLTLAHNLINETQESAFANLPQLEFLSLAHNRLRTIKEGVFHKVPSLSRLDFSHNRIEAFDLDFLGANIHQLQVLDLSHNVIRKLEIQPAKGTLRFLNLRNNQLEFIHGQMLQGFEQLRSVDLSHNDLIELNAGAFWGSHRLERIVLAENNLRQIWRESFRDQQMIHLLDLSGNVLQSLDSGLFGANNLLELDLGRNNLSAIPTRALHSVRGSLSRLGLAQNGITKLDRRDFEGLHNLSELELAGNRIEALEEEVFSMLPRLQKLDLSGNPVASWSPHTFMGLSPSLAHLDLSSAGLFSMPRLRAPFLRSLNLSGNFLYELADTDLDTLPALISLDLSRNRLTELRIQLLERMPQLRVLILSENGLRSMEEDHFRAMPQLEVLTMARMNSLAKLPSPSAWALLPKLHSLELHSLPALEQLDFGQILRFTPPLRQIHFESRAEHFTGTELAKADLRLLRRLTISGESIRQIESNAFGRLRGFRLDLAVENTQIRHFPLQSMVAHLQGISFLRLTLANNRIQTMASPFGGQGQRPPVLNQRGTVLERLDLRGNPLVCDCQMRWLAHWVASVDLVEAEKLIFGECPATMNDEKEEQWPTNSVGQKTVPTLLEWAKRVVNEGGGGGDEEFNGNGQKQCLGHFGPIRDSAEARRSTKWTYWTIWGLCWWLWWIGQRRMANL